MESLERLALREEMALWVRLARLARMASMELPEMMARLAARVVMA
jgi:hypothetical protein